MKKEEIIQRERERIENEMMDKIDVSDPKVHEAIDRVYKIINGVMNK